MRGLWPYFRQEKNNDLPSPLCGLPSYLLKIKEAAKPEDVVPISCGMKVESDDALPAASLVYDEAGRKCVPTGSGCPLACSVF